MLEDMIAGRCVSSILELSPQSCKVSPTTLHPTPITTRPVSVITPTPVVQEPKFSPQWRDS